MRRIPAFDMTYPAQLAHTCDWSGVGRALVQRMRLFRAFDMTHPAQFTLCDSNVFIRVA